MASKRLSSPPPPDLMPEILRLIAEPNSSNSKKKEVPHTQNSVRLINYNYCDVCSGGGKLVCCSNCPKSYHIKCHTPTIHLNQNINWVCQDCAINENNDLNSEVPTNTVNDSENGDTYHDDDEDQEVGFELDNMLPSLVNKIIGNCDSIQRTTYADIRAMMRRQFNMLKPYYEKGEEFLSEIPIKHKYNTKLISRKQLDKAKMIRKTEECNVCKRGFLRGRMVQCNYCLKLYHLNCLDPPIRDWDHSTKFQCPQHKKFFELVYPEIFTPDCGVRTDAITMKRQRCELPSLPVNTFFNVPSHIDALYNKPEENIPTTSKTSLNILCDVASFELKSIESNHKIQNGNNDISTKFLTHPCSNKLQRDNCNLLKQPAASLFCLSFPINVSLKKKSFTIGKNNNSNLCLRPYGNCEHISDNHATITYDSKLGDFLIENHSRYGLIVDNVSYFGNNQPKDVVNNELKKINLQVKKHINKRRRFVRKRKMLRFYQYNESNKVIIKYADKRWKFDYRPMTKYYYNKLRNNKHSYRKIHCKCSKRNLPKNGYNGQAVLRHGSILSIGCLMFKFICDTREITQKKMIKEIEEQISKARAKEVSQELKEDISEPFTKKMSLVCTEDVSMLCTKEANKCEINVSENEVSSINTEEMIKVSEEEITNVSDEEVPEVLTKENPKLNTKKVSTVHAEELIKLSVDGTTSALVKQDGFVKNKQLVNGTRKKSRTDFREFLALALENATIDNTNNSSPYDDQEFQLYLNDMSDYEFLGNDLEINTVNDVMITTHDNDNNSSRFILDHDGNDVSALVSCDNPTLNDVQVHEPTDSLPSVQYFNEMANSIQSCFDNNLIQVQVDDSFPSGEEAIEEEIVYEFNQNDSVEQAGEVQDWIEEIVVDEEDENSVNHQLQLQIDSDVRGDFKTEHLYCARSPTYIMSPIIISSDDDNDE